MEDLLISIDPLARNMLAALIESAGQGLLLCLAAALLLRASASRTNAATRIAVWRVALGAVLALLLADLLGILGPGAASGSRPVTAVLADAGDARVAVPSPPSRLHSGPGPREAEAVAPARPSATAGWARMSLPLRLPVPGPWPARVLLLLLAIAGARVVLLLTAYLQLRGLKARAVPLHGHEERLRRLQAAVGLHRPVRLCTSPEVATPILAGLKHPVILLPELMPEQLTGSELDYVILHELSHLRRRDDWSHTAQLLSEAVFFFHPAVRWIGRRLRLEQEIRCDEWVIALTGRARPYAACLMKLARLKSRTGHLALATGTVLRKHEISRRIEAMLNKAPNSNPRLSRSALATLVWAPLLLTFLLAAAAPLASLPGVAAEIPRPAEAPRPVQAVAMAPAAAPGPQQPAASRPAGEEAEVAQGLREDVYGMKSEKERVDYLSSVGHQALRRPELRELFLKAAASISDDRNLDRLLSGLLEGPWLSWQSRQALLEAARSGFDSEEHLADFMVRKAEYFLGEEKLRAAYHQVADEMESEEARAAVLARRDSRWVRRTNPGRGTSEWVYESPESAAEEALERQGERRRATAVSEPPQEERNASDLPGQLQALRSADPRQRAAAAFAVGQMRAAAAAAVPDLIALLDDETPVERAPGQTSAWWGAGFESKSRTSPAEEAAKALIYIGKQAEPALASYLSSAGSAHPEKAQWALGLLNQFD